MDPSISDEPFHFIDEPIDVIFIQLPILEKTPPCPDGFVWQGVEYQINELLAEWRDYRRRGRMARNMQPAHADRASRVGSWGVGRFFFRVLVQTGEVFDLYYDRSPRDADQRKGSWVLLRQFLRPLEK